MEHGMLIGVWYWKIVPLEYLWDLTFFTRLSSPHNGTLFVFNLNGTSFPEPDFALTPVLWPQPNFMVIFLYVYKWLCFATSFWIKVSKYIFWVKYFSKFAFPDFGVYFGGYHRFVVVPLTVPLSPLEFRRKKDAKTWLLNLRDDDFFHIKKRMFVPKSKDQSVNGTLRRKEIECGFSWTTAMLRNLSLGV